MDKYISQGQVGTPADRTSSVKLDNSGDMALMKQQAGIGNAILAGAKMFVDQMQTADITKASNMYNDKMSELRTQLMQNKEENAMDNMAKYEEGRQKILDEIYKKGPRFVRGGQGRQQFELAIEKDWIGQKNAMRGYVMGESEKYADNQTANRLFGFNQNISDGYSNPMVLEANVEAGAEEVAKRYKYYGTEKIEAATRQWKGQAYGNAINTAMSKEDYQTAGALLQEHGKFIPPEQRQRMEKAISERKKMDVRTTTFESLADKWGDNVEGAVAEFRARNSMTIDLEKGRQFFEGIMGTKRGSNQCANTVSDYLIAAGADDRLITPLADTMQYKAEQAGLAFSDRAELRDGDIVFMDSGTHKASEDVAALSSSTEAYHGTSHVGVYNAKTGKVMQSGESGVSEIPLDYYKVTGYAHPGGRQKSASQLYEEEQGLRQFMNRRITAKKQQLDRNFDNNMKLILSWKDGNMSYDDAMKQAMNAAGADPDKMTSARSAVDAVYYGAGGKGKGLAPGVMIGIEDALRNGLFKSKEQFAMYLADPRLHPTAEQYNQAMRMYDDAQKSTGRFSINKDTILSAILADSKLNANEKAEAKNAAWNGVVDFINDYRLKNKSMPSDTDIIKAGKLAMTEQYYGHQKGGSLFGLRDKAINIAPAKLSAAGVDNSRTYQIDGTNDYYVVFKDPRIPARRMSVVEMYNLTKTKE